MEVIGVVRLTKQECEKALKNLPPEVKPLVKMAAEILAPCMTINTERSAQKED